jgi:hypothetical protein
MGVTKFLLVNICVASVATRVDEISGKVKILLLLVNI